MPYRMGELADTDTIDWSRMNQPFGTLTDTNPVQYRTSTGVEIRPSDINQAIDIGMGVSGGGLGIKAYHSSPHDFDKFDLAKIGTGEGAQVYGHGLYFAENPAVSGQGGQYYKAFEDRFLRENKDPVEGRAFDYFKHTGYDKDAAIKWLDETLAERQARGLTKDPNHQALVDARERLASGGKVGPRTYEVNINADPAHFLDWDKPLAEMSPSVKDALRDTWMAHPEGHSQQTGSQIYKINERQMATGGRGLAYKLNEAGIPGIKYLDQGSRGAGTGSSNFVVFNPAIIDIMKKYGIAAPIGGMGALASQDDYRP